MPKEELEQDFYANLTMPNANEVLVKVPLTSKSINDLFNLPDVEEDEYSTSRKISIRIFFNKFLIWLQVPDPNGF
ncbi:hypothetical protein J1N35_001243 [Gossypium stocksii]|uniref:Uncharacterized protein n=1 Tax=Gossypium stocksii TaxID=47602 RepID=A0A9D3WIQ3_9ROSI|nr:hypothetical protein J1N35_001243 [Gossypium stocksii]